MIEPVDNRGAENSADCPASLAFDEAQRILAAHAGALGPERVPIGEAGIRRLAEPVIANLDGPRWDCAAMDGYAVRDADLRAGRQEFRSVGSVHAGHRTTVTLSEGETMRVMTGAPVPAGTDRVVMIEQCRDLPHAVHIPYSPHDKPHLRRRASDFAAGQTILESGRMLTPAALIAAAAADHSHVAVWRRPTVHIVATGDEILPPGTASARSDKIPDSLTAATALLARQWGGDVVRESRVGDDPQAVLRACIAAKSDVIAIIGGASRGDRDFGRGALDPLGLKLLFRDVAMKPGKPTWYGRIGETHVLGLPGNPTAALTIARLFLAPLLTGLAGGEAPSALAWRLVPLAHALKGNGAREAFLCADMHDSVITVLDRQEASAQAVLGRTSALVRRPAGARDVPPGTPLPTLMI